jgi:hypothetical protein
MVDAN